MTPLRQRMLEDMQLRGFSARTQEAYVHAVRQLAAHFHRPPDQLTEDDLRQYFLYLANVKHFAGLFSPSRADLLARAREQLAVGAASPRPAGPDPPAAAPVIVSAIAPPPPARRVGSAYSTWSRRCRLAGGPHDRPAAPPRPFQPRSTAPALGAARPSPYPGSPTTPLNPLNLQARVAEVGSSSTPPFAAAARGKKPQFVRLRTSGDETLE
jgi:hypothetical protein